MKKFLFLLVLIVLAACSTTETKKAIPTAAGYINETIVQAAADTIKAQNPAADQALPGKGVKHAASLWRAEDGTSDEFTEFVKQNYISEASKRKEVFGKISNYLESM